MHKLASRNAKYKINHTIKFNRFICSGDYCLHLARDSYFIQLSISAFANPTPAATSLIENSQTFG